MGFYTPLVLVIGALVWAFTGNLSHVIAVFIVSPARARSFWPRPARWWRRFPPRCVWEFSSRTWGTSRLAAQINAFVFDKTGTLTTGKLAVSRLDPDGGTDPG